MITTLTTPTMPMLFQDQEHIAEISLLLQAVEGSQDAWTDFIQKFTPLVHVWVRQVSHIILSDYDVEDISNLVWVKFARVMTPRCMMEFPWFSSIMKYLKEIVRTTTIDQGRSRYAQQRPDIVGSLSLDENAYGSSEECIQQVEEQDTLQFLVQTLFAALKNEQERVIFTQLLLKQQRPKDVFQKSDLFETVKDIYRVKRNMVQRLRKDGAICIALGLKPLPLKRTAAKTKKGRLNLAA